MKTKIGMAIVLVLVVAGALAAVKTMQFKTMMKNGEAMVTPPESVSTAVVSQERWQRTLNAIGSITAVQGVTISPEIAGTVRQIAFESGTVVARSDLLVSLDTSSEEAQLSAVKAQLELARLNLERNRKLRQENTVSQAELDSAEATVKQFQGNADAISTTIEKKTIRAPFAGQLGIRQANLGQYLEPGKPIVSLQSLSPVFVDFYLPQQELSRLKTGMKIHLSTDTYPGRSFEGALTAINPGLDASTRSVALQATIENADHSLRPGMFARVEVLLPEDQDVLVIPATAVLSAPYGDSVYVIEPKRDKDGNESGLSARQQFVKTGRARGDFVTIQTGLKAGEKVASSGVFKLRNGTSIVENNELVPKSSETPRPANS